MNIPCNLVLKQCLPCNDDPIRNITAEAPDVNVFIGFRDFKWNPPLGVTYFQLACKAICFSEVSQQDADLCALRSAQACDWNGASDPIVPPVPPGGTGGKGGGTSLPPTNPRNPIRRYGNTVQTCDALCPDGSSFTATVPAGTITELSQALADAKAKSLACKMAHADLFCISGTTPAACVGDSYFAFVTTNGGDDLLWSIDGNLPPGISFDFFDAAFTGTPTVPGSYTFVVEVTDSRGRSQAKVLTICVMEIVTAATLPDATEGMIYSQPIVQQPATVASEVWTLVSGSFPPGILLSTSGSLTGTPTAIGTSVFTLRVDAICDGLPVSCQKTFSLEVVSGIDCLGQAQAVQDLVWTNTGGQPFTISGGDGSAVGTPGGIGANAQSTLCNPTPDAYDLTFTFDWTAGTDGASNSQAVATLNGVDHSSPVQVGNGTFQFVVVLSIPSGPNNILEVSFNQNGFFNLTFNGTVTIRPLTPPP